ncbi:MAG: cytochrome c oxidase assembly protein [Bradyrhizobiaceae bacterium]|nr:cytochrome c oxidase assembly protein [Hyphomicrobiales bacterium]MBV9427209.1 cytochrome c oxidase assembly protein [Bradyrhizobiaceae bacterium]
MNAVPDRNKARRRDFLVAAACGAFVAVMVGAAYAAVPLYSWFCRTTGFGGTPIVAEAAPVKVLDRKVTVRFDANVASGLPWKFEPEQVAIDVRIGQVVTIYYRAINESARETVGQAAYNVSPPTVGGYFAKINCFCFTEQRLKPHERRDMPVVFYVDPALVGDSEQDDLNTITLSYTMYPVQQPAKPVVENARPAGRS